MPLTAIQVFRFFAEQAYLEARSLDQLQAQKLVYFAEAAHQTHLHRSSFNETIFAWPNGPVVRSLYDELKRYGRTPIEVRNFTKDAWAEERPFDEVQEALLLAVWERWKGYTGPNLIDVTHVKGGPWEQVYCPGVRNAEIPRALIKAYFTPDDTRKNVEKPWLPPARTLRVTKDELNDLPQPWFHAARTGAVVQVSPTLDDAPTMSFGQHITEDFLPRAEEGLW